MSDEERTMHETDVSNADVEDAFLTGFLGGVHALRLDTNEPAHPYFDQFHH